MPSNNARQSLSDSEVSEYLNEMRGHHNSDVRELFANKIREEDVCEIRRINKACR